MIRGSKHIRNLMIICLLTLTSSCAVGPLTNDGWLQRGSYYEKTVQYGTTRVDRCAGQNCANDFFRLDTGNEPGHTSITYGRAKVKIPFKKEQGSTAGMSITELIHGIGWHDFASRLTSNDLLVFIHGYNTSFSSAAIRCAQLAHDTNFRGEAVFFSWPSEGRVLAYKIDKERAEENFKPLANFLQDIRLNTEKKIHLVAHSMGTYILTNALVTLDQRMNIEGGLLKSKSEKVEGKLFGQIILAAPDIAKDDYHKKFSEHNLANLADRITLYSTENDRVLDVSQLVNTHIEGANQPRLGDSQKSFSVIKGMDTVDARQEIPDQFFGHSFYAENRSLVTDIFILLNYGTHPDDRLLQKVSDKDDNILWFIRD